jgi:hypothetical protein
VWYLLVFTLATFVDMSAKIFGCSRGSKRSLLCSSSSQVATDSLQKITTNPDLCTAGVNRTESVYHDLVIFNAFGASNDTCQTTIPIPPQPINAPLPLPSPSPTSAPMVPRPTQPPNTPSNLMTPILAAAKSLSPLVMFAAIAAAAMLLLVCFGVFYSFSKKKPDPNNNNNGYDFNRSKDNQNTQSVYSDETKSKHHQSIATTSAPETVKVVYEYIENLFDEMTMHVGDQILVKSRFDDGWAFGKNLTSKQEGNFPLACVAPLNYQSERATSQAPSRNHRDSELSKRTSSLGGFTDRR